MSVVAAMLMQKTVSSGLAFTTKAFRYQTRSMGPADPTSVVVVVSSVLDEML